MRAQYILTTLLLVIMIMPVVHASMQFRRIQEIRDYYDDGVASCFTNTQIVKGMLVMAEPGVNITRVAMYNTSLTTSEEITILMNLYVRENATIAIWITDENIEYFVTAPLDININEKTMVRGVVIVIGYDYYLVGFADSSGSYFSVLSEGYLPLTYRKMVTLNYARTSGNQSFLSVFIGQTNVYVSDDHTKLVPFVASTHVYIVGQLFGNTTGISGVDFAIIAFAERSSRYISIPHIGVTILGTIPGIGIYLHNETHLIVSYSCFYHISPDECGSYRVVIYRENSDEVIDSIDVTQSTTTEYINHVRVLTKHVYIGKISSVRIELYDANNTLIGETSLAVPQYSLLADQYTALLVSIIPTAVVVALAVRLGGMVQVAVGLIASGFIILLLPFIGIVYQGVYATGLLLIILGLVVMVLYKQ